MSQLLYSGDLRSANSKDRQVKRQDNQKEEDGTIEGDGFRR